jgi:hypothetical protein
MHSPGIRDEHRARKLKDAGDPETEGGRKTIAKIARAGNMRRDERCHVILPGMTAMSSGEF